MRGVWSALAQIPLVWNVRSRGRGWKQRQNEKKRGGVGGEERNFLSPGRKQLTNLPCAIMEGWGESKGKILRNMSLN